MLATALPSPAHTTPPAPEPASGRRTSWWDLLTLIVLGLAGGALSYDALRQMAAAVHIRPHLTYLFPLVIDGFIAYGVRALLVLRDAPWLARAYAWTLFATATTASLWANALHAVRLNQPGIHTLTLGDHTVAILSAIAPLALAGATHMHILISRQSSSSRRVAAGTPTMIPAAPTMIPAEGPTGATPTQGTAIRMGPAAETADEAAPETAGPTGDDTTTGESPQSARGGRKAEATIGQLADIIHQTHPDAAQVTRAMARQAIEGRGLSAGNERIAEALRALQPGDGARTHPSTD